MSYFEATGGAIDAKDGCPEATYSDGDAGCRPIPECSGRPALFEPVCKITQTGQIRSSASRSWLLPAVLIAGGLTLFMVMRKR